MIAIKNIIVGIVISLIGSLPLGYLNVVALQIYTVKGWLNLVLFLIGVAIVEAVYIFYTLLGISWLLKKTLFLNGVKVFSILFLLFLAISFYLSTPLPTSFGATPTSFILSYSPFFVGILFSLLNFMQIPFWLGWNTFLIHSKYIETRGGSRYFYLLGTFIGTILGMGIFVLFCQFLLKRYSASFGSIISFVFPIIFLCLAAYQAFCFFSKNKKG